jgi:YVTN family beta-propeller protein
VAVNPDSNSISVYSVVDRTVTEVRTGANPQTVALAADNRTAFVVNHGENSVSFVALPAGPAERVEEVCRDPFAVVAHRERLFVSCFGEGSVVVIDVSSRTRAGVIQVERDPRGLAVSPSGDQLYVTHFTSGRVSVIDIDTGVVTQNISTLPDSNLSQSLFIDAATNLAYLPQTRSNSTNRALLFDTTVFPIVSVLDLSIPGNVPTKRIAIDIADRPSGIPIDAVRAGNRLFVVHAASNDLSVIDLDSGRVVAHLTVGAHPRGMALSPDGRRLYINNALDGTMTVVDVAELRVLETIAITTLPLPPHILNGKKLFHTSADTRLARDRWIACATCHFDGGMDRRTWFFRDGPRNTSSLRGSFATAPFHWSGDLDELADVENTIRIVQSGTGLAPGDSGCTPACDQAPPNGGRSSDLDDLVAFLRTLRHPQRREDLSAAAKLGREIFFSPSTRCAVCHPPPLFTDRRKHDLGTAVSTDERNGPLIDTPSLLGVSHTAPYFHDGSADTVLDVLRRVFPDGTAHGEVSHLSEHELAYLASYVESIGMTDGPGRRRSVRHED